MKNIIEANNLKMFHVKNERTAGYIPSWKRAENTDFSKIISSYAPAKEVVKGENINIADNLNKNDKFNLFDVIDMVNPVQHIPIINNIYRSITGDEIKPVSKIIGGGIFGGAVGIASAVIDTIIEKETGKSAIGNVASLLLNEDDKDIDKNHNNFDKEISAYKYAEFADGRTVGTIIVYS